MIAIGGAIGTGLFYGSASAIQEAGPAIILVYLVTAGVIYLVMRALGEMAVEEPVSGAWVSYSNRYIHRFVGFLNGWNVFIFLLATIGADLNALGRYVHFWLPGVPIWVTAACTVALIFSVNVIGVRFYGETEFWLSMVKVVAIIAMIAFGALMVFFGVGHRGEPVGLGNLVDHGGFFPHGISGTILSVVMVAFAFGGVENLALAAGEAKDVEKDVPKAINTTFWRLLIFYVLAITVLVSIFPWTSLTGDSSPFVEVFASIGIPAAATIMNVVVITAVLSAINSTVFSDTRIIYNLSLQGNAPSILSKVNRNSVPSTATLLVFVIMIGSVGLNVVMPDRAFEVFASVTVFGLVCIWTSILVSHLNFRKARAADGSLERIRYRMPFSPYSNYLALALLVLVIVCIAFLPNMRISLLVSAIWGAVVYVAYRIYIRRPAPSGADDPTDERVMAQDAASS
ncbi:MAG TPA: amino acid permease [Flexivirga sp.]|nr:amino acid permease [Flexivirga sp.]